MRNLTPALEAALQLPHRYHHLRVLVEDPDGTMADVSDRLGLDWLWGSTIAGDIDQLARTLSLQLRRAFGIPSQNLSLAPLMEGSAVNRDQDDYYAPWVDVGRAVEVYGYVSATPAEPSSGDWELIWSGTLDKWDSARPTIELPGRDGFAALLDRQIETARTYDEDAAEDTLQEILDDNLAGEAPTLYVPASPSVTLSEYRQAAEGSVGEAIATIAETFGWYIRERYDQGTEAFRPTLFDVDPDDLSPVWTFAAGTYFRLTKYEVDITDVRNVVGGSFVDPVSGNQVIVTPVQDADSIEAYGRRYAEINVGADSPVKSESELLVLLNAALAALKDPIASVEAECWWHPFLEEGDVVQFEADGENTDVDVVVAIKAARHEYVPGRERTIITGRARPAGAYLRWRRLQRERRAGGGDTPDQNQATIEDFSIAEVVTDQGRYTQTVIALGAHAARWALYERDGAWPTTDDTEGGPVDPRFLVGTFDADDQVRPLRTVPASTTRYAVALALNSSGRLGDRASASTATGTGGPGTDGPALLFFDAYQNVDRVSIEWGRNQTIGAAPGRFVLDIFRDSLVIGLGVAAEDDNDEDLDAVPCSGGADCVYFSFVYRARLRDTLSVYPTREYTAPVGGLWASVGL